MSACDCGRFDCWVCGPSRADLQAENERLTAERDQAEKSMLAISLNLKGVMALADERGAEVQRLQQRVQELEGALRRLMNESHAIEALAGWAVRDEVGYTNYLVWQQRIEEARAALAQTPPAEGER